VIAAMAKFIQQTARQLNSDSPVSAPHSQLAMRCLRVTSSSPTLNQREAKRAQHLLSILLNATSAVQNAWNIRAKSFNAFFQKIVCFAPCNRIEQWFVRVRTNLRAKKCKNSSNAPAEGARWWNCSWAATEESLGVEDARAFNVFLRRAVRFTAASKRLKRSLSTPL
jgi:hypothetical protein